jgi:hypothetical protein
MFGNSEIAACPILGYKMMEQNGTAFPDGGVSSDQVVSVVAPNVPTQAAFIIQLNTAFTRTFRFEGYTMSQDAHMDILLRTCGEEIITLVNVTMKEHVLPYA